MPLDDNVLSEPGIGMGDLTLDEMALALRESAVGQVLRIGALRIRTWTLRDLDGFLHSGHVMTVGEI